MNDHPLVSIIIPTKNSANTIEKSLKSILAQTYDNYEMIIVDNYSSDNTIKLASKYTNKIYVVGNERTSQVNYGIKHAVGKYIYEVGSDFIINERKRKGLLGYLDELSYVIKTIELKSNYKLSNVRIGIGVDPLSFIFLVIISNIYCKVINKIYYVVDYSPKRFGRNSILNFIYKQLIKIACSFADAIWSIDEGVIDVYIKNGFTKPNKIRLVPQSLTNRYLLLMDKRLPYIVYAGSLTETSGVDLAIHAMSMFKEKLPFIKLIIYGTGQYEDKLKKLTKDLG